MTLTDHQISAIIGLINDLQARLGKIESRLADHQSLIDEQSNDLSFLGSEINSIQADLSTNFGPKK